jgi:hypothetical protein
MSGPRGRSITLFFSKPTSGEPHQARRGSTFSCAAPPRGSPPPAPLRHRRDRGSARQLVPRLSGQRLEIGQIRRPPYPQSLPPAMGRLACSPILATDIGAAEDGDQADERLRPRSR